MGSLEHVIDSWLPRQLLTEFARTDRSDFAKRFDDTLFLLVRLSGFSDPLAAGLVATCPMELHALEPRDFSETSPGERTLATDWKTRTPDTRVFDDRINTQMLHEPRFVAPMRKRVPGEKRGVTIGRSYRNDIVLRDRSVSKLHAIVETDEIGSPWIVDQGSKNRIVVNGETVEERKIIKPGDVIHFGRVHGKLCSPAALWHRLAEA